MRVWVGIALLGMLIGCGRSPVARTQAENSHPGYHLSHSAGPGPLFLIGGGDDAPPLLAHFVELAGGPTAPIVVVPFAGGTVQGEMARAAFLDRGATNVRVLSGRPDQLANEKTLLMAAGGIYFAGGLPDNLLARFGPYLTVTKAAWQAGCAIGGSSAGAMVCGSRAIVHGETPEALSHGVGSGGLDIEPAFGLLGSSIVDPHFGARARFIRLWLGAGSTHLLGIGIDEQTAAYVPSTGPMEVSGAGAVTLVKPEGAAGSPARVTVVAAGQSLDLAEWRIK